MDHLPSRRSRAACAGLFLLSFVGSASAQNWPWPAIAMSIDDASPSSGMPGSSPSTMVMSPGVLMSPFVAGTPLGYYTPPMLGLQTAPIVHARLPGTIFGTATQWSLRAECDALSFTPKVTYQRMLINGAANWFFSVDDQSLGTSKGVIPLESAFGEAEGDIFVATCPTFPYGPYQPSVGNAVAADGDGQARSGSTVFGLGLFENAHASDDLDALAWKFQSQTLPNSMQVLTYYSVSQATAQPYGLDGATIFWHLPSAVTHTTGSPWFEPVNQTLAAGTRVFAQPWQLGLTTADDVDACVVVENVWTGYQPSGGLVPSTFVLPGGGIYGIRYPASPQQYPGNYVRDQIFFSITRSSPSVGTLDSNGIPIMPGDILLAPASPTASPLTPPTIVVAAETIGLRVDRLNLDPAQMDDLDALEVHQ